LTQAKAFPPSPGRRPTFKRAGSRLTLAETPLKTQQLKFQATQVVGAKRAYGSHFGFELINQENWD
jgi:hypothetical protein